MKWDTAWSETKDFLDLIFHPSRRITDRDVKEDAIEAEFQTEMASKTSMWRAVLSGEHDWGRQQ